MDSYKVLYEQAQAELALVRKELEELKREMGQSADFQVPPYSAELETPSNVFMKHSLLQKEKEDKGKYGGYVDAIRFLQANNVGIVGESLLQDICAHQQIPSTIDGSKTKQLGGGAIGDGQVNDKSVEIKTARMGQNNSFQHELGEHPWKPDYMAFVDVAVECIYLTIFRNYTEEHYKSGEKCVPHNPTRSATWRKNSGAFKLDTTVAINEAAVTNGFAIKITPETTMAELGEFIRTTVI
jgi:hypothetical protein